jgi:DNA helicase HerA-like ATPase
MDEIKNSNPEQENSIGYIVGGGLKENLRVRLTLPPQQVQEGAFVVVDSGDWRFYGLVTDFSLGATDPRFADEQSEQRLPVDLASLLHGQTLYTNLEVLPALMREIGPEPGSALYSDWLKQHPEPSPLLPIKTIPSHHASVRLANAGDVAEIFGEPKKKGNFIIGSTREQNLPICLNLEKFVQRSAGIFGATGTGKSFLTRIILAGLIQSNRASVLVFDMHNEYSFNDTSSDTGNNVFGLKTKLPGKVQVVALGSGSDVRKNTPDFHLELTEADIRPEDIEILVQELNLKETTSSTLEALVHDFSPSDWFHAFKALENGTVIENEDGKKVPHPNSVAFWANAAGVNTMAAESLHNKLQRVFNKPYIVEQSAGDSLNQIVASLEASKSIVLSFGKHETDLDYLLVTNVLTRLIRDRWVEKTNQFRSQDKPEPRQLILVLEEAHKLLNRQMASQTSFSTIAREMRKYYVTLLIIDQRPSQIYDEVMSQLGTRVSGWLGDDADVQAVLSGLAGRDALRGMLSRLQPKEEVLLLGWGIPMPIPVRSRRYDDQFWKDLLGNKADLSAGELSKKLGF